jgi:predicted nucleic acid-binding Zn ribbon protein
MDRWIRQQAIRELRGYSEPPAQDRCRPVSESVPEVLKRLGLGDRLEEAQVLSAWRELVGDFLATHSCPERLRDGVLYVRVLQPSIHYELDRSWKPRILENLRKRFGARRIREIRLRIG